MVTLTHNVMHYPCLQVITSTQSILLKSKGGISGLAPIYGVLISEISDGSFRFSNEAVSSIWCKLSFVTPPRFLNLLIWQRT